MDAGMLNVAIWSHVERHGLLLNEMEPLGMKWNDIEAYGMMWNVCMKSVA